MLNPYHPFRVVILSQTHHFGKQRELCDTQRCVRRRTPLAAMPRCRIASHQKGGSFKIINYRRRHEEIKMDLGITSERKRLDDIASDSWYAKGANAATIAYSFKVFCRHFRGRRCLEMGPAEGLMTRHLYEHFPELTLVEGAEGFARALRERYPKANLHCSLFEKFSTCEKFDTIVLGHVLEHVDEPATILARAKQWLADDGVIVAAVPNARSLHRQAAVIMGLLKEEHEMNDTDRHHGHRRVYDP